MTDNKKTINDVDVSDCKHYLPTGYCKLQIIFQKTALELPFGEHLECSLCKDCYYKQLKRAEHKLEKIKEILSYCEEQVWCLDCKYKGECDTSGACLNNMILQIIEDKENE